LQSAVLLLTQLAGRVAPKQRSAAEELGASFLENFSGIGAGEGTNPLGPASRDASSMKMLLMSW